MVDLDRFLFSDHRAGGPYLCSLPDEFRPLSKEWEDQNRFRVRKCFALSRVLSGTRPWSYERLIDAGVNTRAATKGCDIL
jgi:hypothetical protein